MVPGEETARIGVMAAAMGAWLVTGVIEKVGATLYCASLTFNPQGEIVNHHRKLMPTATERLVWAQGDGAGLGVVQTPMGVLGGAICWENYMPALRQAMYAKGWRSGAPPPSMSARSGSPRCAISPMRGGCSWSAPANI